MKSTETQLFKSIASRIHPRVILSDKESRRLLDTLKASFRHHLDAAHPQKQEPVRAAPPKTALSFAERHIASVLINPLLAPSTPNEAPLARARHPAEIWTDCVKRGAANFKIALQCLATFTRLSQKSPALLGSPSLQSYPLGTRILQWLQANSFAGRTIFDKVPELARLTVAALVREGHEEIVWAWIEMASHEKMPTTSSIRISPQGFLLQCLLDSAPSGDGSNGLFALTRFIRAPKLPRHDPISTRLLLRSAGISLLGTIKDGDGNGCSITRDSRPPLIQFAESFPLWQNGPHDLAQIDIIDIKFRLSPLDAVTESLELAQRLVSQINDVEHSAKKVAMLQKLSNVLSKHGHTAHSERLSDLIHTPEEPQSGATNKLATLSYLTRELRKRIIGDPKSLALT